MGGGSVREAGSPMMAVLLARFRRERRGGWRAVDCQVIPLWVVGRWQMDFPGEGFSTPFICRKYLKNLLRVVQYTMNQEEHHAVDHR